MNKMRTVLYRYRLMTSVLTLVLLLGVLGVTPTKADLIDPGWDVCSTGCINWNSQQGCVTCQHCCAKKNGDYSCWELSTAACA